MAKNLGFVLAFVLLSGCAVKHTPPEPPKMIEFLPNMSVAERIRHVAYHEHTAWGGSFMDSRGAIRRHQISEAQRSRLSDGQMAWERVMGYWQGSGGIDELSERQNCLKGRFDANRCRAFAMDSAWSAVFVSYVMARSGVAGFKGSPRHFDYIKDAYDGHSPYRYSDPATTAPKVGDMLCYVRGKNHAVVGFLGLSDYLSQHSQWLTAHCDIVVDVHDDEAWLIGGNVYDTVMMRQLPLSEGRFVLNVGQGECRYDNKDACNLSRQNWAVLLQLKTP